LKNWHVLKHLLGNKLTNEQLNAIHDLKRQLVQVGFTPGEVNYLIYDYAGGCKLTDLDPETAEQIKQKLSVHLDIGRKCLKLIIPPPQKGQV